MLRRCDNGRNQLALCAANFSLGLTRRISDGMNTPNVLVALQASGKCSRVWNIANEIAEFRHAQLHVIKLTRRNPSTTTKAHTAKLHAEPHANQPAWPDAVADRTAAVAVKEALEPFVNRAKAINAELVIVAAKRRRGLHRLFRSTPHRVCDSIPCPMLAVRSHGSADGYRRISIAMDPSHSPMNLTKTALRFAKLAIKTKVVVTPPPLRTVPNLESLSGLDWSSMEDVVRFKRQVRSEAADALRHVGLHPKILEVRTGDAFHEIVSSARKMRADLIILNLGKRKSQKTWLLRSTVRRLLNRMPCDVLVCRDE